MKNSNYTYILGSGWWCTEDRNADGRERFFGSEDIRKKAFHQHWYRSICRYTNPTKIFIVDSASPVLPALETSDPRIEFVSLAFNAGHSTHPVGRYCGWMRSVLLGLEYAMANDADYFVYVEQDALLFGQGIVEGCIAQMGGSYMFGSGVGTPQILQQSFFVIRKDGMRRFIQRIHGIEESDAVICPEEKFFIAASRMGWLMRRIYISLKKKKKGLIRKKLLKLLSDRYKNYDLIPFGYGRCRPIDFDQPFYYFQHGTSEEIVDYFRAESFGGLAE